MCIRDRIRPMRTSRTPRPVWRFLFMVPTLQLACAQLQARNVTPPLERVVQELGAAGGCPQPQTLGLEIGLDLCKGVGAYKIAEVDADLTIGLAHRLEL